MSVDKFGRHSTSQVFLEPAVSSRFISNNFLRRDGSNDVQGEINMNNHKLVMLSEPTESQDAATRGYIKNFTRNNFLKLDGTNNMVEDLDLNNHKITNVADPSDDGDAVTKQYVDSRKPLITIWAQEVGPLNRKQYEWSFGTGDYTPANCGYCMPASGRILRGSITSIGESRAAVGVVRVAININRQVMSRNYITKSSIEHSSTTTFAPPIEVAQNNHINFVTAANTPNAVNNIVSLLIELDL